jgi:hypothetical protein
MLADVFGGSGFSGILILVVAVVAAVAIFWAARRKGHQG